MNPRYLPQPNAPGQQRSPTLSDSSEKAWCLWGTRVQFQRTPDPPGTFVNGKVRVVNHESPEYRALALQVLGDDLNPAPAGPNVPIAEVLVSVGVGGETFDRIIQVGPVGLALAIPAGRVYCDVQRHNNAVNGAIKGRISQGLAIPGGVVEYYQVPANGTIVVPAQPFSVNVSVQQFIAGASVTGDIITPWYTFTIAGAGFFGGQWPQQSRSIEFTETNGVAAELLINWQVVSA